MDLFIPDRLEAELKNFNAAIGDIESHLRPLTVENALAEIEKLPPLERAQTFMTIASCSCQLYELYMKAHGQNPKLKDKFVREKKRIVQYETKVQKAATERELATSQRGAAVNVKAASRFIDNALPDLNMDQKAALRQVSRDGVLHKPVTLVAPQTKKAKKRKQDLVEINFLKEMLEDVKKAACDPHVLSDKTEEKAGGEAGGVDKVVEEIANGNSEGCDVVGGCEKEGGDGDKAETLSAQGGQCSEEGEEEGEGGDGDIPGESSQGLDWQEGKKKHRGSESKWRGKQVRERNAGNGVSKRKKPGKKGKATKKRRH